MHVSLPYVHIYKSHVLHHALQRLTQHMEGARLHHDPLIVLIVRNVFQRPTVVHQRLKKLRVLLCLLPGLLAVWLLRG